MNKKNITSFLFSTMGVAIMFVIAVAVYLISGVVKQRIDLTQERLYTLSAGTKAILHKLDTPVEIRFYCSQGSTTPVMLKTYAQRVEDLITEYKKNSKGLLEVKKFDPQPDSDAEDSAGMDGVEGQTIQTGEKIYLGLAVSCLDAKVALPFLSPEREKLLEYDLSRALSQVLSPKKAVIGVMSALPVFGEMNPMMMQMGRANRQNPWVFISELKRDFEVKQVDLGAEKIDDDVQVLMVVHPKGISEKAQFAIDQFVLRGGKLLAFLDPLTVVDSQNSQNSQMNPMQRNLSSGSSLELLLKAWGIAFDTSKVVADMNFVTAISRGARPENMPAVLSLTQEAVDTNDVVTGQIDSLLVPFAGAFSGTPAEGLKQTVLLKTTKNSQLVEKMLAEFSSEQVVKQFAAGGKELPLAIRLTGKFKTAFPEGKPKDKPGDEPKDKDAAKDQPSTEPSLKASQTDGVVVLVGDADMLFDQFSVQVQEVFGQRIVIPRNGNLTLVQNLVEQLAGDSNLIGVRGRATMSRPFTVVKSMQAKAEENYRSKIKDLEKSLSDTQSRLGELQQQKKETGQRFIMSPEQQAELEKFRATERDVKRQLKEVRKNLRQEIDSLENKTKWLNIAGMPFLVTLSGIALALIKRKKTAAQ